MTLLPGEYQHMLIFLRASSSAVRISQVGTQQGGGAACSLRKRYASEGQERQDRLLLQGDVPYAGTISLLPIQWRRSLLFPIWLKKKGVLRSTKIFCSSWCLQQEQGQFTSVSYPNCDVASVVFFDYLHNSFFGYIEENACARPAAAGLHPRDGSISVVKSHRNVFLLQTLTPLNLEKKPTKTKPL